MRRAQRIARPVCEPLERRRLLAGFSGTVFHDRDGNGAQDGGDEGLANFRVYVDANNDGVWQTTEASDLTDATGAWSISFISLAVGSTYRLREVVPATWALSAPASGQHAIIPRFSFSTFTGLDFANAHPVTVTGFLYEDINGDRLQEAGEPAVVGHQVLVRNESSGDQWLSTPSAADGFYTVSGIFAQPGFYTVGQVIPAGWFDTDVFYGALNFQEGQTYGFFTFGSARYGSISGHLYEDTNGNGVQDIGETAPAGASIFIDSNLNQVQDAGEPVTTPAADGSYTFNQLAPGRGYSLVANLPPSYFYNPPFQNHGAFITSGLQATGVDFTLVRFATLTGTVWNDHGGDGVRDAIDGPAAGVKVYLDQNNNGAPTAINWAWGAGNKATLPVVGIPGRLVDLDVVVNGNAADNTKTLTLTGPNGATATLISGIKGALNSVRLDDEATRTLAQGTDPFSGSYRPPTPLSVFDGINPNGNWTVPLDGAAAGHVTVQDWTLYMTMEDPSATTGADGTYTIQYAMPGTTPLRIVPPPGWRATSPTTTVMAATRSGQTTAAPTDLGATQRTLASGRVFNDLNGNGTQNAGEAGLAGVTVYDDLNDDAALNAATVNVASADTPKAITDNGTTTTTSTIPVAGLLGRLTDVDVHLDINHPFDADLDVFLVSPAGTRVELFTDVGSDGDNFTGTILDDQAATAITAGVPPFTGRFKPEGSLAAFNHEDPNGTWTLEVTDDTAGFAGTLLGWSMDFAYAEPSAVTDATGAYQLEPLPPSRYLIRQVPPAGMGQTAPAAGFHDVTLAAAQVATGLDFGDRDNVPPRVVTETFPFALKPHRIDVQFSEDVSASLLAAGSAALVLVNHTTNVTIPASDLLLTLGAGNTVTWTYTANGGVLPDGNYTATIAAAATKDAAGNPMAADVPYNFFVLAGDANRDRVVNFADLLTLARNYGGTGKTWQDGDFDGNGLVNFNDLLILARGYNHSLPLPAPATLPPVTAAVRPFSVRRVVRPAGSRVHYS